MEGLGPGLGYLIFILLAVDIHYSITRNQEWTVTTNSMQEWLELKKFLETEILTHLEVLSL